MKLDITVLRAGNGHDIASWILYPTTHTINEAKLRLVVIPDEILRTRIELD